MECYNRQYVVRKLLKKTEDSKKRKTDGMKLTKVVSKWLTVTHGLSRFTIKLKTALILQC